MNGTLINQIPELTESVQTTDSLTSMESFQDLSGLLEPLGEDLRSICTGSGSDFLELGQDLQSLYADVSELGTKVTAMMGVMNGEGEADVLARIGRVVEHSLEELEKNRGRLSDKLACIQACLQQFQIFGERWSGTRKLAVILRTIGLNIGIESSRSGSHASRFAIVGKEINELAAKIIKIFKSGNEDIDAALACQSSTYELLSKGVVKLNDLAETAHHTVQEAMQGIEQLMALAMNTLKKVDSQSQLITRQVGEIVMGIQFHDNMSQRVEHVVQAFEDLRNDQSKGEDVDEDDEGASESLAKAHFILKIQSSQLQQVVSEIDQLFHGSADAFERIQEGIRSIGSLMYEIDADSDSRGMAHDPYATDFHTVHRSDGQPAKCLRTALEHLLDLLHQGNELSRNMEGSASQASELVTKVSERTGTINQISSDTHIIALNSIVNAAHLGDGGNVLCVLSQEIKQLSQQAMVYTDDIFGYLERIKNHAAKLHESPQDSPLDSGNEIETVDWESALVTGIEDFSSSYGTFCQESREIRGMAESLAERASLVRERLSFLVQLSKHLEASKDRLKKTVDVLEPWAKEFPVDTEALAVRYTMDREREIHACAASPTEQADLVEFNENPALEKEAPESLDEEVELWGDSQDESAEDAFEFGEDVELF